MPLLSVALMEAGLSDVQTYLQSGNLIFTSDLKEQQEIAALIQETIKKDFDLDVPVLVLTGKQLKAAKDNNPFSEQDQTKLHITFLEKKPDIALVNSINKEKYLPDEFLVESEIIYLYCPTGYGKTKLTNNFFENKLEQTATTRNWNTVCKLAGLTVAI